MKDTKFFEQALELVAPWKVLEVNMDVSAKKIEVKVDCGSNSLRPKQNYHVPPRDLPALGCVGLTTSLGY
jgi:hypothetical protein